MGSELPKWVLDAIPRDRADALSAGLERSITDSGLRMRVEGSVGIVQSGARTIAHVELADLVTMVRERDAGFVSRTLDGMFASFALHADVLRLGLGWRRTFASASIQVAGSR